MIFKLVLLHLLVFTLNVLFVDRFGYFSVIIMETPPHDTPNHTTGRRQTRSALLEIPARLGMLTVADEITNTPTTVIGM